MTTTRPSTTRPPTTSPPQQSSTTGHGFAALGVPRDLVDELDRHGITAPFPIQVSTVPDALAGRDVTGRAPTGSGKTLAFAIPAITRFHRARPNRPSALVLTPTRELAAQIRVTMDLLAAGRDCRVATVYGGTNVNRDIDRLRSGVDVLVATPGRLEDLVQRGACSLGDVRLVVLDEADRMADMGFLPPVTRLLDQTAADRQTLLFSATLDGDVDVLIRRYQHDPVRHVEEPVEQTGEVTHHFWSATRDTRRPQTVQALRTASPAIVFTRTKRGADRLARQLATAGVTTAAIHGNRNQNQRERALRQFSEGTVQALVATDVAARGIHVDDVALVVHFDLPASDKDYVHRSGRTGRAGADGAVVSLVMEDQVADARAIQRSLDLPTGTEPMDLSRLDRSSGSADVASATVGAPRETSRSTTPSGGARPRARRRSGRRR